MVFFFVFAKGRKKSLLYSITMDMIFGRGWLRHRLCFTFYYIYTQTRIIIHKNESNR